MDYFSKFENRAIRRDFGQLSDRTWQIVRFFAYVKDEGFSNTRPASFPLLLWENGLLYTTFKAIGE